MSASFSAWKSRSRPDSQALPSIEYEVEGANDHARHCQGGCRDVRIDQLVEIVEQETSLVGLDARLLFPPVLEKSQGTGPRQQLRDNSPDQRNDMQPAKNRTRSREQSPEDHPHDK